MIQLYEPEITEEDIQAVQDTLKSGWLNEHIETRLFEEHFAKTMGTKYAVASNSGTSALFLALKAAGVDYGSRVAVPDYTAIGSVRAVQLAGASAVLVDVDYRGNIDVDSAKQADASHVIAVHNNGYPCNINELINHFGKEYVIEDACQGLGSHYANGKPLGSQSAFGCFSLASTKIVTAMGQGGVTVTDDYEHYEYMQRLKNQGNFRGVDPVDTYPELGYNFKWTEPQAAFALSQLKRLPDNVSRVKNLVELYYKHACVAVPPKHVTPWRIHVRVSERQQGGIIDYMREYGVKAAPFFKPLHVHAGLKVFPRSERYAAEGIYLPSSLNLTEGQVETVCDRFKEAFYG